MASGGNAGLAQAFVARNLSIRATVFVPHTAPDVKVERIQAYGADVNRVGSEYAEAYEAAVAFGEQTGAAFAHAYDQLEVAAGAGTLAEEIREDEPAIDTIIVAVGGGGLYAGVEASAVRRARARRGRARTLPHAEPRHETGHPVDVPVSGVASDSLGARRLGDLAFAAQEKEPPTSVLVTDDDIIHARSSLWNDYRVPSEAGAATAYAALLSGRYVPEDGERVAVVICGANTHLSTLA